MIRSKPWALFLIATTFIACGNSTENGAGSDAATTTSVGVVHPQQRTFQAELVLAGTVMADKLVKINARESGYVKSVLKDVGDRVRSSDVLAVLENPELLRQRQELQAQLLSKKQVNDRLQSTYSTTPALVPLQQVEDAQAALNMVKAKLDAVQDRLGFLQVRAPFAGVITMRSVDVGATIQSGTGSSSAKVLFELQAIDPVRATFQVGGSDAHRVRTGSTVLITFPDMVDSTRNATVSRTSKSLDASSGTMQVEVDIPNTDRAIRPGMSVNGAFIQESEANVLSLPIAAQQFERGTFYLWLVKDGTVEKIALRKGSENKEFFEVIEPKLDANSLVIIEGRNQVRPGQQVEAIVK